MRERERRERVMTWTYGGETNRGRGQGTSQKASRGRQRMSPVYANVCRCVYLCVKILFLCDMYDDVDSDRQQKEV